MTQGYAINDKTRSQLQNRLHRRLFLFLKQCDSVRLVKLTCDLGAPHDASGPSITISLPFTFSKYGIPRYRFGRGYINYDTSCEKEKGYRYILKIHLTFFKHSKSPISYGRSSASDSHIPFSSGEQSRLPQERSQSGHRQAESCTRDPGCSACDSHNYCESIVGYVLYLLQMKYMCLLLFNYEPFLFTICRSNVFHHIKGRSPAAGE
jgi:hypothetical protein